MKKSQLKKLIKEELNKSNPHKNTLNIWNKVVKKRYGNDYNLEPDTQFETSENKTVYNLRKGNDFDSIWSFVVIYNNGVSKPPNNFYDEDDGKYDKRDIWVDNPFLDILKPLTNEDIPYLIKYLKKL